MNIYGGINYNGKTYRNGFQLSNFLYPFNNGHSLTSYFRKKKHVKYIFCINRKRYVKIVHKYKTNFVTDRQLGDVCIICG